MNSEGTLALSRDGEKGKPGTSGGGGGGGKEGRTELPISQRPSLHAGATPEKSKGKKKYTG